MSGFLCQNVDEMLVVLDDKVRFRVYSGISVYPAHIRYMRWVYRYMQRIQYMREYTLGYRYTRIDTKPDLVLQHNDNLTHNFT